VEELVARAEPSGERVEPIDEPSPEAPPESVVRAFAGQSELTPALWASLSPLDRFALCKVSERSRPERMAAAWREIVGARAVSTHLGPRGGARMIDVSEKPETLRRAVAESFVTMGAEAFGRLAGASAAKGDVLGAARLAGIMAAKRTAELIPLCHSLQLTHVQLDLDLDPERRRVRICSTVVTLDRTGVEMEALVAASVAALTVYDMLKAYDKGMEIGPTRLLSKSGGRSGEFSR
jgi:cyclic pyranopterin phosphate synthase